MINQRLNHQAGNVLFIADLPEKGAGDVLTEGERLCALHDTVRERMLALQLYGYIGGAFPNFMLSLAVIGIGRLSAELSRWPSLFSSAIC